MRRFPRLDAALIVSVVAICASLLASCTSSPDETAAFCDRLTEATSSNGAESLFGPVDPERVTATAEELRELASVSPDDIAPTVSGLADLFVELGDTNEDEWPNLLIDNEGEMRQWSDGLTTYALDNCGLFLQRAPQPTPTSAPLIGDE